jgi:hypothetical protein
MRRYASYRGVARIEMPSAAPLPVRSNKAAREWPIACPNPEIASFHETARKSEVQYRCIDLRALKDPKSKF